MGEPDDVLYSGDWLTARAMRRSNGTLPAADWADALDSRGQGQVKAAFAVLENTLRSNRPPAGRAVEVYKPVWELRVTKAGGTPPHHRLFYVRARRTVWVTHGFTKQSNKTPQREISKAVQIYEEWLEGK